MTKGSTEVDFNVFVGAETGILKGININNKTNISKNFHNLSNLQKEFEITCLSFGESQNEILLGLRNQTVKVYDVQFRSFSQSLETKVNGKSNIESVRLFFLVTFSFFLAAEENLYKGRPKKTRYFMTLSQKVGR